MGGAQSERTDAAGREDRAVVLAGHLEDVPQTVDADAPGQTWLALGYHGEQGGQVVDGINVVFLHGVGYLLGIGDVGKGHGPRLAKCPFRLSARDVASHHMLVAIAAT